MLFIFIKLIIIPESKKDKAFMIILPFIEVVDNKKLAIIGPMIIVEESNIDKIELAFVIWLVSTTWGIIELFVALFSSSHIPNINVVKNIVWVDILNNRVISVNPLSIFVKIIIFFLSNLSINVPINGVNIKVGTNWKIKKLPKTKDEPVSWYK